MEQSRGLSKIEYWKKWELFELFEDLNNAEKLLTELLNNPVEDNFNETFKNDFIEELHDVKVAIWGTLQLFGGGLLQTRNGIL